MPLCPTVSLQFNDAVNLRRQRFAGTLGLMTAIMLPLFASSKVEAATYYWDTNGATAGSGAATGTWGTSVFWSTDGTGSIAPTITTPTTADNLFVAAGTNGTTGTITVSTTQAANSITLDDNVAITISGGTGLSLGSTTGAGVFVASGNNAANSISTPITLSAASTFSNSGTGTLTLGGALGLGTNTLAINGSGATTVGGIISGTTATGTNVLTIGGTATATLSNAANTFTGDITINGGKLSYTGATTTTTSQLGRGSGTAYKQVFLTNGGTFQVASNDFNVNTPSATNPAAGVIFNIGTGGGTFDVAAAKTFTIDDGTGAGTALTNSQLQGSGTLTKTGAGALSLGNGTSSNAVFTGQILVNAGVLRLGALGAAGVGLGSTTAGTVIASGAGFDINNNASTAAEPVTINGAGVGGTGNVIFSSNAAGGSFAGPITLGSSSTIGSTSAGTLTFGAGATFNLGANTLTVRNLGTGRVFTDGVISGTGTVEVNNTATGDYVPRAGHIYSGDTTLTAGSVAIDADSVGTPGSPTAGPFGTGTLKLAGAQLRSSSGTPRTIGNTVSLNADTSFYTVATEKTLTFSGPVTMTGGNRTLTSAVGTTVPGTTVLFNGAIGDGGNGLGLIKAGLGNVTLAGANTYTGGTTVNTGSLVISGSLAANTALSVAAGATFSLGNGAANPLITVSSLNLGAGTGTVTLGLDLGSSSDFIATSNPATVANTVAFNLTPITGLGAGTYNLLSAPSGLTSGGATYSITSAPGGFTYTLNATDSLVKVTTAATAPGNLYWRGDAGTTSWSTFNGANTNWYTDAAGTTNAGYNPGSGNTVIFSSSNAGGPAIATKLDNLFFINDLQFSSSPAGVTSVAIAPGLTPSVTPGVLTIAPSSATAGITLPANVGVATISAPIVLGAAQTWTLDATGSTLATSGGITGTVPLSLVAAAGAPTLTMSGANVYTGATTIGAGVNLTQGAANGLPSASAITVDGTLSTGAFAGTVGSLAGGVGTVRNGSATNAVLTVGNDGANASFAGIMQNGSTGTLGLTKAGVGTQILSGANAYTGGTVVNAGILRLSGSNGATAVTVNTGGTLQIGSPTALSTLNGVTLAGTGTFDLFGNSVTVAGFTNTATNTVTNTGSGTGTDALTINTGGVAVPALVTDGPTRKTQLVVNNNNTNTQITTNTGNTFSGGLVLAHNTLNGTRLSPGTITGTPWGTGPIIVGQTPTDKAGIYFANAGQTLSNPIIMNTALGNDRVGIRVDVAGTVLSGVLTANLAPLTFTSNTALGTVSLTNQVTGPKGLVLDIVSLSSATTAFLVTLSNATANPNDYQGDTVINYNAVNAKSATLALGLADQIPNGTGTGNVIINSNGTGIGLLNLAGFNETINGLSGNGTIDGTSGTPTLTVGDNNATSTFSGIIRNTAGTLTLQKIGTGNITLAGSSTFSGPLVINAGLVSFATSPASNGPLGASPTVNLNGGGISFTASGINDLNRPISIGAGNGTVEVGSSTGILSIPDITSTGGNLIKTGPGVAQANSTLTLNGGAAAAVVNEGTLVTSFGASGISALTVGASGKMNFTNNNTEALTLANLTLAGGARIGFELGGVANDSITVTNAPTVAGTITLDFTTTSPPVAGTYNLISAAAGGLNAATFVLGSAPAGFNYSIARTNTLVSLTLTAYTPIYWNSLANNSWATLNAGANYNWTSDGAGASNSLATPGTADTVIFSSANATGPILTTDLNGAFTVDSLQFTSTPGGVTAVNINSGAGGTLNVNPISSSGGIRVFANAGDVTIAAPLTVSAAQTWDVDASGASLAVTGNAAFNSAINKTGTGAVTLSGNNTGTATINLSGGTLNLNSAAALGAATLRIGAGTAIDNSSAGLVSLANNAQIWSGDFTYLGNTQSLDLGNGAITLDVSVAANIQNNVLTVGGVIGDGGNNRALAKMGVGTLVLSGANTFGGGVILNAGALSLGNAGALGTGSFTINGGTIDNSQGSALTLNSTTQTWNSGFTFTGTNSLNLGGGSIVMTTTPTVNVTASTLTAGNINGGLNGLVKDGQGTLTLSGANAYLGNTVVNGGVLNVTGTLTGNNTTTALIYGNTAGNTVVNVSNNLTAYIMSGANVAGSNAVYNQTGGTVTISPPNSDIQYVAKTGYGYFNLTGGTFRDTRRFDVNGVSTAANGVAYIGGTGILNNDGGEWMIIAYGGLGQLTVGPGGSLTRVGATSPLGIMLNQTGAYGVLNIANGSVDTGTQPIRFGNGGISNTTGFVNLAGGTLAIGANSAINVASGTGNNAYFNFAGGTLKSTATMTSALVPGTGFITVTNTIFGPIDNSAVSGAPSFVGGLTVDTNGFPTTIATALNGAIGTGVTQANLTVTGGSGYIGAPAVQFSNVGVSVGGTPATGYALISGGAVTGIVITNPGTYDAGTVPTVTLVGGGGTGASVTCSALNTANTAAGLTKLGANSLSLSGANTYTGDTVISAGTLQLGAAGTSGSLATTSTIVNNGVFAINQTDAVVQGTDFTASPLTGPGSLLQAGTGTTTLISANTYADTTISAGTLQIGNGGTVGTLGTGVVTLTAGTLSFNHSDTYTMLPTNLVTGAGAVTIASGAVATVLDGQFNTTGPLNVGGPTTTAIFDLTNGSSTFGGLTSTTNNAAANTVTIPTGKSLTINGNVSLNNQTLNANTALTLSGGGSLAVTGVTFIVGNNTTGTNTASKATLNLSGLGAVSVTLSGALTVQATGDNTAANASSVIWSNTANTITAASILVGNSSTGSPNTFILGTGTNVINTNLINLGNGTRDTGIINFAGAGGSLTLRNVAGTGRVPNVNLGPQAAQTTAYTTADLIDLTGHTADVAIGTFATSLGAKTAVNTNDLKFDAGTLDILTVNMAVAKGTGASTNKISIGGGVVKLGGSTAFGDLGTGTVTLATAGSGELLITGGIVTSSVDILKGTGSGTARITLSGGTLDLSNKSIGLTGKLIDFLTLESGTLRNVAEFNNGANLNKTTIGTLLLDTANAFTGQVLVNAGVLQVKHGNALGDPVAGTVVSFDTALELSGNIMVAGESLSLTGSGIANGGALRNTAGVNIFAGPVSLSSASRINSDAGSLVLDVGVGSAIVSVNQDLTLGGAGTIVVGDAVTLGTGSLIKDGTGTAELTTLNSYSGSTTVNAGTLKLDDKSLDDAAAVTIAGGAFMDLNFAGVDIVGSLTINGVTLPNGVYSAATHPAALTGTGKLQVGTSSAYATWAAAKGLDGSPGKESGTSDDPDKDGNTNLAEFAFDGDPLDPKSNSKVYVFTADSDADLDADKELILTIAVRKTAPAFAGSPSPSSDSTTDGILYAIEGGTALSPFGVASVPVTPITTGLPVYGGADDYEYRSFSLTGSNSLPSRGFFRARATTP